MRFIFEKLCFIVTLARNVTRYISCYLFSKFNTEIYKNSSASYSVLRPLPGLRPWTHWGLPYSKPHETAPLILGLRSAHDQKAEGIERKENGNGISHSISVDQRI